jgi:hypothetical protein
MEDFLIEHDLVRAGEGVAGDRGGAADCSLMFLCHTLTRILF